MKYLYLFLAALMLCSCSAPKKGTRVPAPAVQNTSEITNIEQQPVYQVPVDDYVIIGGYRTNDRLSRANRETEVSLSITRTRSADLSGIEQYVNLESLRISLPETSDIDFSPLRSLPKLQYIYIYGSALAEIPDLSGIPSLVFMKLDNNSLTSLSGLESVPQLEWLIIDNACVPITDTSVLRYLKNLRSFHIYNSSFNIDFINLVDSLKLEEIYFSNCGERDLTGIGQLLQLKYLYLNEAITSVGFLADNLNLERLELIAGKGRPDYYTGTPLPLDVAPLGNLKKLRYLSLRGFELINAHVLDTLPELQRINTALWDPE